MQKVLLAIAALGSQKRHSTPGKETKFSKEGYKKRQFREFLDSPVGLDYQIGLGSILGRRTSSHGAIKKKKKLRFIITAKKKSYLSVGYFLNLKKMFSMLKLKELNLSNVFRQNITVR